MPLPSPPLRRTVSGHWRLPAGVSAAVASLVATVGFAASGQTPSDTLEAAQVVAGPEWVFHSGGQRLGLGVGAGDRQRVNEHAGEFVAGYTTDVEPFFMARHYPQGAGAAWTHRAPEGTLGLVEAGELYAALLASEWGHGILRACTASEFLYAVQVDGAGTDTARLLVVPDAVEVCGGSHPDVPDPRPGVVTDAEDADGPQEPSALRAIGDTAACASARGVRDLSVQGEWVVLDGPARHGYITSHREVPDSPTELADGLLVVLGGLSPASQFGGWSISAHLHCLPGANDWRPSAGRSGCGAYLDDYPRFCVTPPEPGHEAAWGARLAAAEARLQAFREDWRGEHEPTCHQNWAAIGDRACSRND